MFELAALFMIAAVLGTVLLGLLLVAGLVKLFFGVLEVAVLPVVALAGLVLLCFVGPILLAVGAAVIVPVLLVLAVLGLLILPIVVVASLVGALA